ncbi:Hippurate hydrolase [Azospirillaceae bacterium]
MPILHRVSEFHHDMILWRRTLHAYPETAFEEVKTAAFVAEQLRTFGVEVHEGIAGTGVVGVLRSGTGGGRSIGLRADMDALNMQEENQFEHVSRYPGKMHGCGHDGHTVMLLGAARYLAETCNFDGTVNFIFQPAEEGKGGGRAMVEAGLFQRFPCDQIYGVHNWPELPLGTFGVRAGPIMAAADRFEIFVEGQGAHGAMPHHGVDPVVVAAHIVTAAQSLISRSTDPLDSAVVSITMINGGTTFNVIPSKVTLAGTVRSFRPATRDMIERELARIASGVAAAFGATAVLRYNRTYPATVNTKLEADFAAKVAMDVVGETQVVINPEPSMGAEDFSFMLNERPGCYVWLGQGGGADSCMIHNPRYDFNDAILPIGASYWSRLVEMALPRVSSPARSAVMSSRVVNFDRGAVQS